MRRRAAAMAGLTAVLIAAAGCGQKGAGNGIASANGKPKATASSAADKGDTRSQMLKYTKCMRDNGIDMPDATDNGNGPGVVVGGGSDTRKAPDKKKFEAATKKCQSLLPPAPNGGKISEKDKENALKFARCMRANGVNMPDPTFDGSAMAQRLDGDAERGDKKKFEAALKKCNNGNGPGLHVTQAEPAQGS